MVDLDAAFITLGAEVGGRDADIAILDHLMKFRVLLAKECSGPHGVDLTEIALILRVDGSIQSWGLSGVKNVRLQKKARYATADIFMPSAIWKSGNSREIRAFILTGAKLGVETILAKALRAKLNIDYVNITRRFQNASHAYLEELGNANLQ